jgi:hypothetical protein
MENLIKVKELISRIKFKCLDKEFDLIAKHDEIYRFSDSLHSYREPRIYIQVQYTATCNKTGFTDKWHGRKWYLSEYMTDDEVIKTCYVACEAVVKHEIMEGFKVDDIILFNPHINYEKLLEISDYEVKRDS